MMRLRRRSAEHSGPAVPVRVEMHAGDTSSIVGKVELTDADPTVWRTQIAFMLRRIANEFENGDP